MSFSDFPDFSNLKVVVDLKSLRMHPRIRPLPHHDKELIEKNHVKNIKKLLFPQGVQEKNIFYESMEFKEGDEVLSFGNRSFVELDLTYLKEKIKEEKANRVSICFWEENTTREILGRKELALIHTILGKKEKFIDSDYFTDSGIYYEKISPSSKTSQDCSIVIGGLQYNFDKLGFEVNLQEIFSLQKKIEERLDAFSFRPCLFLDRDGVIIEDKHYLKDPSQIVLKEGLIPILQHFQKNLGYLLCVVSNQAGIARGKLSLDDYRKITTQLDNTLKEKGIFIDAWYYCPYLCEESLKDSPYGRESFLRKPYPGMVWKAQEDFLINLGKSLMIGDKGSDLFHLLGLPTYILQDQYELHFESKYQEKANVFNNLDDLAKDLLDHFKISL